MFKQVVYNTYIGKSQLGIMNQRDILEGTTKIGDISYPCIILDKNRDTLTWPDYYLMGWFEPASDADPANFFHILKPWNKIIHHLYITGIPKDAPSLEPYRLENCLWSSYYEDDFHGYLFQILRSNELLKLKQYEPISN